MVDSAAIRASIAELQDRLRTFPRDIDAIAACEVELAAVASEITGAIETEFAFADPSRPNAA